MGKKTHPAAIRTDFNGWENVAWVEKKSKIPNLVLEDHLIRTEAKKHFPLGLLGKVVIERFLGNCSITLHTSRPGFLIGENGINIQKLTIDLEKKHKIKAKVNVAEILKPESDPQLICDQIVSALEKRMDYKKAVKNAMRFAMRCSSVKGILVVVAGRLNGASIARVEKFRNGSVAMQTFRDKIIHVSRPAKTVFGICGIKVFVSYHRLGGQNVIFTKRS